MEGELSPHEGVQPEEAMTSRAEHGAFSFPAGFKVATQHLCAGAKHPKRSKPTSCVGLPGLEPAPEGVRQGKQVLLAGQDWEGDALPSPHQNGESPGDHSVWAWV